MILLEGKCSFGIDTEFTNDWWEAAEPMSLEQITAGLKRAHLDVDRVPIEGIRLG